VAVFEAIFERHRAPVWGYFRADCSIRAALKN
jgi:hypothetical protein